MSSMFTPRLTPALLRLSDILQASCYPSDATSTVTRSPIALYESLHVNPDHLRIPIRERFLLFKLRP